MDRTADLLLSNSSSLWSASTMHTAAAQWVVVASCLFGLYGGSTAWTISDEQGDAHSLSLDAA